MKKTVNVNIASQSFTIDEDAYGALESYYNNVSSRLGVSERTEVMEDIKLRTADIFREQLSFSSQVVDIALIKRVISTIGQPESFGEQPGGSKERESNSQESRPRRLYRSRNRVIGGVCGGIAQYLGIDILVVRLLTFIFIFFGGLSLWVYIIMWIVLPTEPENRVGAGYKREGKL